MPTKSNTSEEFENNRGDSDSKSSSRKTEGQQRANSLEQHAVEADVGVLREFLDFLRDNKKWWLIPLLGSLLLVGLLSILAASGAAPFIYTVF